MKWEWLRVGRRIEWTTGGLSLFGILLLGLTSGFETHSVVVGVLVGVGLGGMLSATLPLPMYLLLVRRRQREAAGLFGRRSQQLSTRGRAKFYLVLLLLTIASARVQATHGFIASFGSVSAVYFWNLALCGAVIALSEFRQRRQRRPPPLPK